jgi:hypothetical protein
MRAVCPLVQFAPLRGVLLVLVVIAAGVSACSDREPPVSPVEGQELPDDPAPVDAPMVDALVVRWEAPRAHKIDPGPTGTLFVLEPNSGYRSLSVLDGVCAIKPAQADELFWRGGVIGVHAGLGANQVAVEVRPLGEQLMLKLVHAFWIEVLDAETGEPVAEVELLRHHEPGASSEHAPPAVGQERAVDLLYAGRKNPVRVNKSDLHSPSRTLWVRAPGHAWTAVQLHADSAALQRVVLTRE